MAIEPQGSTLVLPTTSGGLSNGISDHEQEALKALEQKRIEEWITKNLLPAIEAVLSNQAASTLKPSAKDLGLSNDEFEEAMKAQRDQDTQNTLASILKLPKDQIAEAIDAGLTGKEIADALKAQGKFDKQAKPDNGITEEQMREALRAGLNKKQIDEALARQKEMDEERSLMSALGLTKEEFAKLKAQQALEAQTYSAPTPSLAEPQTSRPQSSLESFQKRISIDEHFNVPNDALFQTPITPPNEMDEERSLMSALGLTKEEFAELKAQQALEAQTYSAPTPSPVTQQSSPTQTAFEAFQKRISVDEHFNVPNDALFQTPITPPNEMDEERSLMSALQLTPKEFEDFKAQQLIEAQTYSATNPSPVTQQSSPIQTAFEAFQKPISADEYAGIPNDNSVQPPIALDPPTQFSQAFIDEQKKAWEQFEREKKGKQQNVLADYAGRTTQPSPATPSSNPRVTTIHGVSIHEEAVKSLQPNKFVLDEVIDFKYREFAERCKDTPEICVVRPAEAQLIKEAGDIFNISNVVPDNARVVCFPVCDSVAAEYDPRNPTLQEGAYWTTLVMVRGIPEGSPTTFHHLDSHGGYANVEEALKLANQVLPGTTKLDRNSEQFKIPRTQGQVHNDCGIFVIKNTELVVDEYLRMAQNNTKQAFRVENAFIGKTIDAKEVRKELLATIESKRDAHTVSATPTPVSNERQQPAQPDRWKKFVLNSPKEELSAEKREIREAAVAALNEAFEVLPDTATKLAVKPEANEIYKRAKAVYENTLNGELKRLNPGANDPMRHVGQAKLEHAKNVARQAALEAATHGVLSKAAAIAEKNITATNMKQEKVEKHTAPKKTGR